jgi:hypothetical protein
MRSLRPSHTLSLALLAGCAALPAQAPGAGDPPTTPPAPSAAPQQPPTDAPWRLNRALGGPGWLKVGGEHRTRYESLDNQFRFRNANANPPVRNYAENDDALMLQTLLRVDASGDVFGATLEGIDARQYGLHDEAGTANDSFVDTSMVDSADVLQAYATVQLGRSGGGAHELRVGRETMDLGGRRLVGRNVYRNTINAFTGASWQWRSDESLLRAFWTLPVDRRPNDAEDLFDNRQEWDDQDLDLQFAGVYFESKLAGKARYEVYAFGLDERGANTRQRELLTFGGRVHQARKAGDWFYAIELVGQAGESKTSATATNVSDHQAAFGHAAIGYQWDASWTPAVQLAYDHASGDKDPNDRDNERFDTLFGARRWEYGPTGLYGAVARSNLDSSELRVLLHPRKHLQFTLGYRLVFLASDRDAWTASGLRDRTGGSGDHVGDQFELRMRWEVVPQSVEFDFGVCYLAEGSFQDRASQGQGEDVTYGYAQVTWKF